MRIIKTVHSFEGGCIYTLQCGPMDNLQYFIVDSSTKTAAAIDPAWEIDAIDTHIQIHGWQLAAILLTHTHHDHIHGLDDLSSRYPDVPVHLSKQECDFCQTPLPSNIQMLDDEQRIVLGQTSINVLHAFGHTPGSVCYQVGDYLFSGDSLFVFGSGRCDLRCGDAKVLFSTLQKLATLPSYLVVLPGHDYGNRLFTTLGEQIKGNPFLMIDDLDTFVWYRNLGHKRETPYHPVDQQYVDEIKANYLQTN